VFNTKRAFLKKKGSFMKNLLLIIFLSCTLVGCASHKFEGYTKYTNTKKITHKNNLQFVQIAPQPILFLGQANPTNSGSENGAMVYPGGFGLGGFIASIATHAAIANSAAEARKNKIQNEANKITVPFQEYISKTQLNTLLEQAMKEQTLFSKIDTVSTEQIKNVDTVEFAPVLFMTQDMKQLYIRNVGVIYNPLKKTKAFYQNQVEVFSEPVKAKDIMNYWTNDDGSKLQETVSDLMRISTNLLLKDMLGSDKFDKKDRNIQYYVGSKKYFERGKINNTSCNYLLLKTLRNWLKLIPRSVLKNNNTKCPDDKKEVSSN
jgi:hypothetical protein